MKDYITTIVMIIMAIAGLIVYKLGGVKGIIKLIKENKNRQLITTSIEAAEGITFGYKKPSFLGKVVCSPTEAEGSVLAVATSGTGKTSAIAIPSLQSWGGTSFCIDISGDIEPNVNKPNKLVYEPLNPHSTPYNVFGAIDELNDEFEKNEALVQLALNILPEPLGISQSDAGRYFLQGGRDILTAALIAFYHRGDDFIKIAETVVRSNCDQLFAKIIETDNKYAIQYILRFAGVERDKGTIGCCQSAQEAMSLFATNESIKHSIRRPREDEIAFTPSAIEKFNVLVNIPDEKLELFKPLLHIITSQVLEYFSARPNYPENSILLVLDEFASLGRLDILSALRKYRKKRVRLLVLTQSLVDLDLIYGRDERIAMVNNFPYKVVLGLNELSEQRYFSDLIGEHAVIKTTTQKSEFNSVKGSSETKIEEPILKPAELAHLGNDLILIHPNGYERLKKNYYFKDHVSFKKRLEIITNWRYHMNDS